MKKLMYADTRRIVEDFNFVYENAIGGKSRDNHYYDDIKNIDFSEIDYSDTDDFENDEDDEKWYEWSEMVEKAHHYIELIGEIEEYDEED